MHDGETAVEVPPVPVEVIKPPEGATGWSDTWMINSKTKNLACAYAYIDYLTEECVDGRTDVTCKGFDDWIKAWTEIKG